MFDASSTIYTKARKSGHDDHDTAAVCAVLEAPVLVVETALVEAVAALEGAGPEVSGAETATNPAWAEGPCCGRERD